MHARQHPPRRLAPSLLLGVASACQSPPPPPAAAPAPPHETFVLASRILGEARTIHVHRARGNTAEAAAPDGAWPVLYVLDGGLDEDFPHVVASVDELVTLGVIGPRLVVGIPNTERRRDLTGPTRVAADREIAPRVGGAPAFRRFLAEELLPAIDARYPTTGERALLGESLAGLFVVETFLESPALFTHGIALDPSLWWNGGALVTAAAERLQAAGAAPRSLYLATADVADLTAPTVRLVEALRASAPPGVWWRYDPRPDLTHATIFRALESTALAAALR